ncbi:Hypothetical protein, putative [Bodo saltans]|uniref:Uncharacterized protein n=1 Tax=Bodo saltans TaxID=75058 RepID=A0A0S4JAA5_BODSA|nr:Hypothetical protein, putative [Bodo saltans]|eukprot:CUG86926.1 Hypothetical protein, putative [Bodo saltans]
MFSGSKLASVNIYESPRMFPICDARLLKQVKIKSASVSATVVCYTKGNTEDWSILFFTCTSYTNVLAAESIKSLQPNPVRLGRKKSVYYFLFILLSF